MSSTPPPVPGSDHEADFADQKAAVESIARAHGEITDEVRKVIVGQGEVIEELLIALFAGGHCLLTGAPGLAKTLLVRSLASSLGLDFRRIQFTPDLMPADIVGTEILEDREEGGREMVFHPGPVFTNLLLADEINRTPPKTQAALLEGMAEGQITAAGQTLLLPKPFFVLATQNPIEMEGTYPLPEAQLDRFMFNIYVDYPGEDDEVAIVSRTTAKLDAEIRAVLDGPSLEAAQAAVREVPVASDIVRYAVRIAAASRPGDDDTPGFISEYVSWGAGIRAAQNLILGGKARALLHGRAHVTTEDVEALAPPVLRHRILVNYKAEAAGTNTEDIIKQLLDTVKP